MYKHDKKSGLNVERSIWFDILALLIGTTAMFSVISAASELNTTVYIISGISLIAAMLETFGYIYLVRRPPIGLTLLSVAGIIRGTGYVVNGSTVNEAFTLEGVTVLFYIAGIIVSILIADKLNEEQVKSLKATERLKKDFLCERDAHEVHLTASLIMIGTAMTVSGYIGNTTLVWLEKPTNYIMALGLTFPMFQILTNAMYQTVSYKIYIAKTVFDIMYLFMKKEILDVPLMWSIAGEVLTCVVLVGMLIRTRNKQSE